MQNDINEMVIMGLTEDERITVRNGNPLIKSIALHDKEGKKIPALATVYNRPGNGVYRKQTYGVVLIPMSIETLRNFSQALSNQADKLEDANLDLNDALIGKELENKEINSEAASV